MKNTVILAILAIILVGMAWFMSSSEEKGLQDAAPPVRVVFGGPVTSSTLTKIEITAPKEKTVVLQAKDSVWFCDADMKYKADFNLVSKLLNKLETKISGEVVSTAADDSNNYGLAETSATRIKLYRNNGDVDDWLVGKMSTSYTSTYVKKFGTNETLNADTNLLDAFHNTTGWRDRMILNLKSTDVIEVDVKGTTDTYTMFVEGKEYRIKDRDTTVALAKANAIINGVCSLQANGFPDDDTTRSLSDMGLEPPKQELTIVYRDESTSDGIAQKTILFGDNDKVRNLTYMKLKDSPIVFFGEPTAIKRLLPSLEDLAPLPPPKATVEVNDRVTTE